MTSDPELYFAEDGAPRSGRFGDIYYSLQDGLSETRAVFLGGCRLPESWAGRAQFSLLELGFGTGLNIAAVMQLWAQTRAPGAQLHIFSVEGFLMSAADAGQALRNWPELTVFSESILSQWPKARRGFHYMDFPQWGVSLTIGLMDVRSALTRWGGRADAIFLDGFSPALNPDMWADDILSLVGARARPGARLATFTVAGAVRRGLHAAGFEVAKCPGYGRKRERLEAVFAGEPEPEPEPEQQAARPQRIAIIGAGIAGCALAFQARQAGVIADVFDSAGPGAGASGNVAGLMTPRLDAGDNAISALFADAFAYAGSLYRRLCPEAILGEGVQQFEASARDGRRFDRIIEQEGFAPGDLRRFKAGDDPDVPMTGGIDLASALTIRPMSVLEALLGDQAVIQARITAVIASTVEADGQVFGDYDAVVLACGEGVLDLGDPARLQPVRGQVEQVSASGRPHSAMAWGGYAVPLDGGFVFGATHVRDDRGSDARKADRAHNIANLASVMPDLAAQIADLPMQSRAAVRIMTADYLPSVGRMASGVWVMTGLGARGFCLAPLLAKHLIGRVLDAPAVLPSDVARLIDSHRFSV